MNLVVLGKVCSVQVEEFPEALVYGLSTVTTHCKAHYHPLLLTFHTCYLMFQGIILIILDVKMESASIVKICTEREWCNVVKAGQKVKVKMKDKFIGVVIEKSLLQAK